MIKNLSEADFEIPRIAGTEGVKLYWLIGQKDGAKNYGMRLFVVEPGGKIPVHQHPDIQHEIYIVEGTATLETRDKKITVKAGDAIFIRPGEEHGFTNNTESLFKFICVIPLY